MLARGWLLSVLVVTALAVPAAADPSLEVLQLDGDGRAIGAPARPDGGYFSFDDWFGSTELADAEDVARAAEDADALPPAADPALERLADPNAAEHPLSPGSPSEEPASGGSSSAGQGAPDEGGADGGDAGGSEPAPDGEGEEGAPFPQIDPLLSGLPALPEAPHADSLLGALPAVPDFDALVPGPSPGPAPGEEDPEQVLAPAQGGAPSITLPHTPNAAVIAVIALGALAAATGAGLGTPFAAWTTRALAALRILGVALYARVAGEKVLDHGKRSEILDFLRAKPGACLTEIQDAVEAGLTTVRYHLSVLQRNGLVSDVKSGRRRCYFARGDGVPATARPAAAALSSPPMRRVFEAIRRRPGIAQRELAAALAVTPTSVIFHAKRLEQAGVVRRARCGREMTYYPMIAADAGGATAAGPAIASA